MERGRSLLLVFVVVSLLGIVAFFDVTCVEPCFSGNNKFSLRVVSSRRVLTTTLNVTTTDDDFPATFTVQFLEWFWYALVGPVAVLICACTLNCYYRFIDAREELLSEETEIVLLTDYQGTVNSKTGVNISASLMNHAEHGIQKKVDQPRYNMLEDTELKNNLSQILTIVEENMARLGLSVDALFDSGAVEIEATPGVRSFHRQPGLAHWEFISVLEKIGVRMDHREATQLCSFLDPKQTTRILPASLTEALRANERTLHKRGDLPKLPSPVESDKKHWLLDEPLLRLHRGIGLQDITTARRLMDSYNRGYFTSLEFEALIKEHHVLLTAAEVVQLEAAMKDRPTDKNLSTALFGVILGQAITRYEQALMIELLSKKRSVYQIIMPTLISSKSVSDAVDGVVSYNMLVSACRQLEQGQEAATLLGAALGDDTCGETGESGDLITSSAVRADTLIFACVGAWRRSVLDKGFRYLSQASAFGHLPASQAAKVLLGGKDVDTLSQVEAALVTHLLGGAGVTSHALSLNGWRAYVSGLMTGLVLCDTTGDARDKGKATKRSLDAYLSTLKGLVLHSIFDRISSFLALSGRTLYEIYSNLAPSQDTNEEKQEDTSKLSHENFRSLLATFKVPLYQEEVVTLIARYDKENSGYLDMTELISDSRRFAAADEVWSSLSDGLGPAGGAQLLLPSNAAPAGAAAARQHNEPEAREIASQKALNGTCLPLSVLRSSLIRSCNVVIEKEDWANINPELDPTGCGCATIECFMILISAHRARRIDRAWTQVTPKWQGKTVFEVLQGFGVATQSISGHIILTSSEMNYETFVDGLASFNITASGELLRSLLLLLDPYEMGKIKVPLLELMIRKKLKEKDLSNQNKSQVIQYNNESSDDLDDFSMAFDAYNVRWRRELTELSAQSKLTEAEQNYYADVTELISINSTALSCLSSLRSESSMEALSKGGFSLARGRKAKSLLTSRQLRLNLLLILELQRDLTNVYLLARGFRLHGSAFPPSEEKRRLKLLSRLRKYKEDILLMAQVGGVEGSGLDKKKNDEAGNAGDTPESQVLAANTLWRSRAADRLWANFAEQLTASSEKAMMDLTSSDKVYALVQKQFQSFDDGSGEITYWEFFEGLRKLGAQTDEMESDLMIQALDATGSGKIKLELMMKHFSRVLQETSNAPPAALALTMVAGSINEAVESTLNSTAKFVVDVFGDTGNRQLEPSEHAKAIMMTKFLGNDPELAHSVEAHEYVPPKPPTYRDLAAKNNSDPLTAKVLAVGTPVLALHEETGDRFRATVLVDHGDGFVDVQYNLAILGRKIRQSKKEVMTLKRGAELERIWIEVSRVVGKEGVSEVLRVASDAAGKISHSGLIAWLQSKGLGSLESHDKHMLLADLDPLCKGVINVSRFKSKLAKYRAQAGAKGIHMFSATAQVPIQSNNENEEDDDDDDDFGGFDKLSKSLEKGTSSKNNGQGETDHFSLETEELDEVRMEQLEAMMLTMAKREQELTQALIESQAKAERLNKEIDHMGRVAKT